MAYIWSITVSVCYLVEADLQNVKSVWAYLGHDLCGSVKQQK